LLLFRVVCLHARCLPVWTGRVCEREEEEEEEESACVNITCGFSCS